MWQLLCATLYTAILASENFEKLHNDILSKITNNLRRVNSDPRIDTEDSTEPSNQTQQSIEIQFATSDYNESQKLKFRIETPSQNYFDLNKDGRRHDSKPVFRVKTYRNLKRLLKKHQEIKPTVPNNTMGFPYMAAIIINGRLWCAGAIVDENWVLTAAHCLNYVIHVSPLNSLGTYVKVRVGSIHPHQGGRVIDVVGAVRHPKFEEEPVPHADVALLKLAENINLGKYAHIIKIYEGIGEPFAHSFIVVSGWGATKGADTSFREHTPDLGKARLKVRSQHYCRDAYQLVNGFQFTQDFFCASLRNGSSDLCLFDAGAPAVQHNRLMGIMSFGPERCGHESQPAVFIKAFYFRDFVKSTISSYKTTQELIEAIKDMEPNFKETPFVRPVSIEESENMV